MLMLSGPVELLLLLFLIAARTCSVVMFICVGCRLSPFLVIFRTGHRGQLNTHYHQTTYP